jgi:hypothetical protein
MAAGTIVHRKAVAAPMACRANGLRAAESCILPAGRAMLIAILPEHDPEKWKPVFRKDHAPLRY